MSSVRIRQAPPSDISDTIRQPLLGSVSSCRTPGSSEPLHIVQRDNQRRRSQPRMCCDGIPQGVPTMTLSKSSTLTKVFIHVVKAGKVHALTGSDPWGLQRDPGRRTSVFLLPDQIKRDKGVWWMPWRQEAMKDVALCDKSRGGESTL